jgi:hypothetical protein
MPGNSNGYGGLGRLNPVEVRNPPRRGTAGSGQGCFFCQLELGFCGQEQGGFLVIGSTIHGPSLKWHRCTTSSDQDAKAHNPTFVGKHHNHLDLET